MQSRLGPSPQARQGSGGGGALGFWADGTLAAPGAAFDLDRDTGIYRPAANDMRLVTGATEAARFRADTYGPRVHFGNLPAWGGLTAANIVAVTHQTTADTTGICGFTSQVLADSVNSTVPGAFPDGVAVNGTIWQSTATANGAIRAGEFHAIRSFASAGSDPNASVMALELGIHSQRAGNGLYKHMGIYLVANDANGTTNAPRQDTALYIHGGGGTPGTGGWSHLLYYRDNDFPVHGTPLLDINASGNILVNTAHNNAAAPAFSFIGESNKGLYSAGTNVVGLAAAGVEVARGTASGWAVTLGEALNGVITPSPLSGNTDNWNPPGLGTARVIRVVATTPCTLSGLQAFTPNALITFQNPGGNTITLPHDTTSAVGNRFLNPGGANIALTWNASTTYRYDTTLTRWVYHSGKF